MESSDKFETHEELPWPSQQELRQGPAWRREFYRGLRAADRLIKQVQASIAGRAPREASV